MLQCTLHAEVLKLIVKKNLGDDVYDPFIAHVLLRGKKTER